MPTYEYACKSCGHVFEIVQSMKDDALTACPECGGELRKVFAPPTITFKGSGFYATDHGKKAKSASSPDKKDTGDKEGPRESKAESKSEKAESKAESKSEKSEKSEKKGEGGSSSSSSTTTKKEGSS